MAGGSRTSLWLCLNSSYCSVTVHLKLGSLRMLIISWKRHVRTWSVAVQCILAQSATVEMWNGWWWGLRCLRLASFDDLGAIPCIYLMFRNKFLESCAVLDLVSYIYIYIHTVLDSERKTRSPFLHWEMVCSYCTRMLENYYWSHLWKIVCQKWGLAAGISKNYYLSFVLTLLEVSIGFWRGNVIVKTTGINTSV